MTAAPTLEMKQTSNKKNGKKNNKKKKAAKVDQTRPSFLGLLNAIAVAETENEHYLLAWADKTKDPKLEKTLRFVAMREGEHGKAFAKRMLELGYSVRWPEVTAPNGKRANGKGASGKGANGKGANEKMRCAASSKSDAKKFKLLQVGRKPGGADVFDRMFEDKHLDPVTGGLLGRYIAEERDSARLLHAARQRVC